MQPKVYNIENLRCNAFARGGNLFDMCRFEHFIRETTIAKRVHRHNYYMILLATSGSGKHIVDFKSYDIHAGQVFLMYPGQVHAWDEEDDLKGFLLFFTAEFFNLRYHNNMLTAFPFFGSSHRQPFVKLPSASQERLVTLFQYMQEEYKTQGEDYLKALRSYLNISLIECKRHYSPMKDSDEQKALHTTLVVRNFEQLIDTHFRAKHKVKDYATMLLLTPNYLNAICNKVLGKSAGELIRERIMLEARRMLLYDDRTIAEIGSELNFDDNSYFSRFFKKYEGLTPERFRKKYV